MLQLLVVASCILWGIASTLLVPSAVRSFARGCSENVWRAVVMFAALLISSFNFRRLIQWDEGVLVPLYLLSILLAAFVLVLVLRDEIPALIAWLRRRRP